MNAFGNAAARMIVRRTLSYCEKDPLRNIPRVTRALRRMPDSRNLPNAINMVDEVLKDKNNPYTRLILRSFSELAPEVWKRFVANFVVNASMIGSTKAKENRARGVPVPWAILLDPTSACNLKCIGCWAAEYNQKDSLDYETMDRIIREGKELGTYFYIFSGGEPLVRKEELISLAEAHRDCMFLAFTNGTLVGEHFALELARLGNFGLAFSAEGAEEATDFRRGKGTYAKVIAAMDIMKRAGAPFGFSTCYHAKNVDAVADESYLDFLIEKGCLFGWYFTYIPCGKDADLELMTPPEKRAMMLHRVRDWRDRKPIFLLDFWNDGEYVDGCIAGAKSYIHINAAGDIEPCAFIHYSDSSIKGRSLKEALGSPLLAAYRKGQPFNCNHLRPCPLLDNPGALRAIVKETGARSTQPIDEESVETLTAKCEEAAASWAPVADELWKKIEPNYLHRKQSLARVN